jgi:uncharacterized membrane protein
MDKKTKKILIVVGAIEAAILIFCLTVSIIVLAKWSSTMTAVQRVEANGALIGWFQNNPTYFFILIVLPVFVIFLVDAIYLIVYSSKKPSALTDDEREAIQAQAREEARKELEAEMKAHQKPEDDKTAK